MTTPQLVHKLRTDANFLTEVIVFNNPNAVLGKLEQSTDFVDAQDIENADQLLQVIKQLQGEGEIELTNKILTVPFNEANATPQLIEAHNQLIKERGEKTLDGKFLETQGGLLLLSKAPKTTNNNSNVVANCGCNGKVIRITGKQIVIGLVVLVVTFLLLKNIKK